MPSWFAVSGRGVTAFQNRTPNQARIRFSATHSTQHHENNRAEKSHEATRVRERGIGKFKSVRQAQRFLGVHAAVSNLFNLGRHLVSAEHYRNLRVSAFEEWRNAVA